MDIARDALPLARDAYGITMSDVLPPALVDAPPSDAQDALPTDGGTMAAPDALPPAPDVYGVVDVFQPTGGADGGARD
jgi:hypothetical protein